MKISKQTLKRIGSIILPPPISNLLLSSYRNFATRERRVSYGCENKDKTFYVIGQHCVTGGLIWITFKAIMHIAYAIDKGWIPIIDLQNFNTFYRDCEVTETNNVWEYYFDQPMGYNLDDIKDSKNIVLSSFKLYPNKKYLIKTFYRDAESIKYFKLLYQKYIKYNANTLAYLSDEYDQLIAGKGRVVGVLCRGTDYIISKPKGHHIQPNPLEVIEKTKSVMTEYKCDYVYLSTEDEGNYQLFKSAFKEKLIVNKQNRIKNGELKPGELICNIKTRERGNFQPGLEYLSSLNILSKCTCFIAGCCSGTTGVQMMSEGFEYEHIYDLGKY